MLHKVLPVVAEAVVAEAVVAEVVVAEVVVAEEIGAVDGGRGGMARESAAATLGSPVSTRLRAASSSW
jgi:hypothetical protein